MGFISAGGYHHHLGLNTWQGEGAPPPPADAVGLRYFTINLPNQEALDDVVARVNNAGIASNQTDDGLLLYDPSQNGVVLRKVDVVVISKMPSRSEERYLRPTLAPHCVCCSAGKSSYFWGRERGRYSKCHHNHQLLTHREQFRKNFNYRQNSEFSLRTRSFCTKHCS